VIDGVTKAFERYFQMIVDANRLAMERGESDAHRLVQLRRELGQVTLTMDRVVDEAMRDPRVSETTFPFLREHRTRFSDERSTVSRHQSKWIALDMKNDRSGYEADVRALFQMHMDNHVWRMQVFLPALASLLTADVTTPTQE
jgi:hypothetical protein